MYTFTRRNHIETLSYSFLLFLPAPCCSSFRAFVHWPCRQTHVQVISLIHFFSFKMCHIQLAVLTKRASFHTNSQSVWRRRAPSQFLLCKPNWGFSLIDIYDSPYTFLSCVGTYSICSSYNVRWCVEHHWFAHTIHSVHFFSFSRYMHPPGSCPAYVASLPFVKVVCTTLRCIMPLNQRQRFTSSLTDILPRSFIFIHLLVMFHPSFQSLLTTHWYTHTNHTHTNHTHTTHISRSAVTTKKK
jgi:hypothetical protein